MGRLGGGTRVHTRALSGSLTISNNDSEPPVLRASLIVQSGTCTITGNFNYQGVSSNSITLSAGQTDTITATGPNAPLDGITITAIGGITNIMLSF